MFQKLKFTEIFLNLLNFSRRKKIFFILIIDIFCALISTFISFFLRYDLKLSFFDYTLMPLILSLSFIVFFFIFRIYNYFSRYIGINSVKKFTYSLFFYTIFYFSIINYLSQPGVPRSVGLIQPIIFSLLIFINRVSIIQFLNYINSNFNLKNAIIYGNHKNASEYLNKIKDYKIAAIIDEKIKLKKYSIDGIPILNLNDLNNFFSKIYIDKIFIILENNNFIFRKDLRKKFEIYNKDISFIPSIDELVKGKYSIKEINMIQLDDLIERKIKWNKDKIKNYINEKVIVITGGGGSIGSELVKQIHSCRPKKLILIENNEYNLYKIINDIEEIDINHNLIPCLISLNDFEQVENIFNEYKPDIVFHAAAYKHVPILETNIISAVKNNIFSSINLINLSIKNNVNDFILISSDKAVRPTNIMGATKRFVELYLQSLVMEKNIDEFTSLSAVRFGNVLGSAGSVVPLFNEQIDNNGPVTITHKEMTRYFMTIPEAVGLILETCIFKNKSKIFFLNMGKPIKIIELVKKMIELKGKKIKINDFDDGISIKYIGLRPGEKLHEELIISGKSEKTIHPDINVAIEDHLSHSIMVNHLDELKNSVKQKNIIAIKKIFKKTVEGFKS